MVEKGLDANWYGIQMPFEHWTNYYELLGVKDPSSSLSHYISTLVLILPDRDIFRQVSEPTGHLQLLRFPLHSCAPGRMWVGQNDDL